MTLAYIQSTMADPNTILCIHRDPEQLALLQEKGYGLVTATTGSDGLRLLMTRPVDAVILEYHLGLLDGAVVADEIRQVKPELPIVMVADPQALPHEALHSVDTLVDKSAGPHFLWAALHFLLTTKAEERSARRAEARTPQPSLPGETPLSLAEIWAKPRRRALDHQRSLFSPEL